MKTLARLAFAAFVLAFPVAGRTDNAQRPPAIEIRVEAQYICYCVAFVMHDRYAIDIDAAGNVMFDGRADTAVRGKHRAKLSPAKVLEAYEAVARSAAGADPSVFGGMGAAVLGSVSIRRAGKEILTRSFIYDPHVDNQIMRKGSRVTIDRFDRSFDADHRHPVIDALNNVIDIDRWIRGNDATVPALAAEGWNFKSATRENLDLIAAIARLGTVKVMRDLLQRGSPVGQTSALEIAAARGEDGIVDLLLAERIRWPKAQLNAAVVKISAHGNLPTVRRLIAAGADIRAMLPFTDTTALMNATRSGSPELVAFVLQNDRRVNITDAEGRAVLLHAVLGATSNDTVAAGVDATRVVELLLAAGARVNAIDRRSSTPLFYVGQRADIARVLLARGASVNHVDKLGYTALIKSLEFPTTVKVLLDHGANPNRDPRSKNTPLLLTERRPAVFKLLIDAGADVNARDLLGNTLLMYCPHHAIVSELLRAGANPMLRNNKGESVLDVLNAKTTDHKCPPDTTLTVGRSIEAAKKRK